MTEEEVLATSQYLAFELESESFAFDIGRVREVLEFVSVTRVPQTATPLLACH